MVIQQKAGPATGFVLVLSPLETTRNKVHTVSNFGVAEQGAGAEAVLCVCVCVRLWQRQEAEKRTGSPVLDARANAVQDVLV